MTFQPAVRRMILATAIFLAIALTLFLTGPSGIGVTLAQANGQVGNSPATGLPTISGTVQVGETLTADTAGIADGLANVSYTYQWLADDSDISGGYRVHIHPRKSRRGQNRQAAGDLHRRCGQRGGADQRGDGGGGCPAQLPSDRPANHNRNCHARALANGGHTKSGRKGVPMKVKIVGASLAILILIVGVTWYGFSTNSKIENLQSRQTRLQGELTSTQTKLETTRDDLSSAKIEISSTKQELASTQTKLETTRG